MEQDAINDDSADNRCARDQDFTSQLQVVAGNNLADQRDERDDTQFEAQQALDAPVIDEEQGNRIGLDKLDFLMLQHDIGHGKVESTREDKPSGLGFQSNLGKTNRFPARCADPLQRFHDVAFPRPARPMILV